MALFLIQTKIADLMSYCTPTWISKYTHQMVFNAPMLNPTAVPVGAAGPITTMAAPDVSFGEPQGPAQLIVIWGSSNNGEVDVSSVVRLTTLYREGIETDLTVEILDRDETVLSSAAAVALENHGGCGCSGTHAVVATGGKDASFDFRADLPDIATGHLLRVRRGDDILWTRNRYNRLPRVAQVDARIRRDGKLEVSWKATVGDGATSHAWITCSAPDGSDHQGLATSVSGTRCVIDVSSLAGGKAIIKVMISDGFSCASGTSRIVDVPGQADEAVILYPQPGDMLPAEGALCLQGLTSDHRDSPIDACEWWLDGKLVGDMPDITVPMPNPGKHRVEFRAGEASTSCRFVVLLHPADAQPDEN